eukprot:UN28410
MNDKEDISSKDADNLVRNTEVTNLAKTSILIDIQYNKKSFYSSTIPQNNNMKNRRLYTESAKTTGGRKNYDHLCPDKELLRRPTISQSHNDPFYADVYITHEELSYTCLFCQLLQIFALIMSVRQVLGACIPEVTKRIEYICLRLLEDFGF